MEFSLVRDTFEALILGTGVIVIAAAAVQAVAYLFRSQITLRFFLLIGNLLYMLYYFVAADQPLWAAIAGTTAIVITSVYGFGRALLNRSTWIIPNDFKPIFEKIGSIEPGAFCHLMQGAKIVEYSGVERLTEQDQMPDSVYFTLGSEVDVSKQGIGFTSEPYRFIGEISIMGAFPASATVYSRAGTRAVKWDRDWLIDQMDRNERFKIAVEALFARDMAFKLAQAAKLEAHSHAYAS